MIPNWEDSQDNIFMEKDVFKNIGAKVFGQTLKRAAKTAATKAVTTAATKSGEHVGKKAGDKIISMLSKSKTPKKSNFC